MAHTEPTAIVLSKVRYCLGEA